MSDTFIFFTNAINGLRCAVRQSAIEDIEYLPNNKEGEICIYVYTTGVRAGNQNPFYLKGREAEGLLASLNKVKASSIETR